MNERNETNERKNKNKYFFRSEFKLRFSDLINYYLILKQCQLSCQI